MYSVAVNNFNEWRQVSRKLLQRCVPPRDIAWQQQKQQSLLLGNEEEDFLSLKIQLEQPSIPKEFMGLATKVACYRDESRWSLLYSVAWRIIFEDRQLLNFTIDPQVSQLLSMNKAVGRDKHKMEAFVRFRLIKTTNDDDNEYFVAWFEPDHLIIPLVTPFFTKRFHNITWSILTPDTCLHWDGEQVLLTEGTTRPPAIEDELETLWLEYYANIFNPARLKLKAMQSEMPKKYWVNLPEAPLIAELIRSAGAQVEKMIVKGASSAWTKTANSQYIREQQSKLRS